MPELAIDGGPQAAVSLDPPRWPRLADRSRETIEECLESETWCRISEGAGWVSRFEERFGEYHDADHALAVANGTVALELALSMCGVQPGDEVLVPSYTFVATASAVVERGAVPRLVDVDPRTYTVDPESVEERITDRTVGLIGVHFAGYPIDFDRLLPIVEDHDLFLIEDVAHAHGTEWRGRKVGTIGDVGTFSFQDSKPLASGEGGMVVTDDDRLGGRGDLLHNIGRDPEDRGYTGFAYPSSNYRLSELQAALLSGQFDTFPAETEQRQATAERLTEQLRRIDGIRPKPRDDRVTQRGYYLYNVNYDAEAFDGLDRETFLEALVAEGVPARGTTYEHPLYELEALSRGAVEARVPDDADVPLYSHLHHPGSERIAEASVTLPHEVLLVDEAEIDTIAAAIRKIRDNVDDLR